MREPFEYLNQYYDNIFVLSVENASERRKLFEKRFEGLNYTFFYGIDKKNFNIEDLQKKGIFSDTLTRQHHRTNKSMKSGEIACSWSHKKIYEDMLTNGYKRILIFEDDAVPNEKIISRIPEILEEIPDDCELLMWGWAKNDNRFFTARTKELLYHIQHKVGTLKWNHTMIKNLHAKPFSKHLKKSGFHDYTYAYAITSQAAEKFLKMQTPIQYLADNLLAYAATNQIVNGYIINPPVFLHDALPDGTPKASYIR